MRAYPKFLSLLCVVPVLVACSGDDGGDGGGTTTTDTGAAVDDTGSTTTDTGSTTEDSTIEDTGSEPTDTGTAPTDTGTAPTDTGTAPTDTGTAPTDTGTAPTDTGTAPTDTGTAPTDTGTAPTDTGTAPTDTGTAPDTTVTDTGTAPDTAPTDTGTAPDTSVTDTGPSVPVLASCNALHIAQPSLPSGAYDIDPDGTSGGAAPFKVYCDMTNNGGGWTLLMKADGWQPTWAYFAELWTNTTTLNPTSTDLSDTEHKSAAYSTVAFSDMMIGMKDTGVVRYMTQTVGPKTSLRALIDGPYYSLGSGDNQGTGVAATGVRADWFKLLGPTAGLQPNCNRAGINNNITNYTRARIGIVANQENDCNSTDSVIGFGIDVTVCGLAQPITVGNKAGCPTVLTANGTSVAALERGFWGYVFVR